MKIKVKELNPGDRFGYGMKSAIVLDKMDDGVLCMVVDEQYRAAFDKERYNNFAKSTLRTELNGDYLNQWINAGASLNDFVMMKVDLTADDGLDNYGICECYLAPRTCDQHKKYRKLIPYHYELEWTATAHFMKNLNGFTSAVNLVEFDGTLCYGNCSCSIIVRPLFKLKPDAEVEAEIDITNGVGESSLMDTIRKLVDEYGFPEVTETLTKVIAG